MPTPDPAIKRILDENPTLVADEIHIIKASPEAHAAIEATTRQARRLFSNEEHERICSHLGTLEKPRTAAQFPNEYLLSIGGRIGARYLKDSLHHLGLADLAARIDPEAFPESDADKRFRMLSELARTKPVRPLAITQRPE